MFFKPYQLSNVFKTTCCVLIVTISVVLPAYALPQGAQVEAGDVQFEQVDANTLHITASDQAVINWTSFDIGTNEVVRFFQPAQTSSVMARVLGGAPTLIEGGLFSAGILILTNMAGIHIAPTATIDTGSFIASSLNLTTENFLQGDYQFEQIDGVSPGTVVNEAIVRVRDGGFFAMLGGAVTNSGLIVAKTGSVALASGKAVTLSFDEHELISVVVDKALDEVVLDADGNEVDSGVLNTGEIQADGGYVTLKAAAVSNIFDKLINQEGIIQADSAVERGGVIELIASGGVVRNAGDIRANGTSKNANAGKVEMQGDYIIHRGRIEANAAEGGTAGEIDMVSQYGTLLTYGSVIEAMANGLNGQGGDIYINALQGSTEFRSGAWIDISGGQTGGDAGFIEISARDYLGYEGTMRGVAAEGFQGGRVFFDPLDVIITDTGVDTVDGGDEPSGTVDESFTESPGSTLRFDPRAGGAFDGFDEVHIQATRDIRVDSDWDVPTSVGADGTAKVKLEAGRDVRLNRNLTTENNDVDIFADRNIIFANNRQIKITGSGNLTLTADADNSGSGAVTMGSGSGMETDSGNIDVTGSSNFSLRDVKSTSGNINISSKAEVRLRSGSVQTGGAGTISVTADSDANSSGDLRTDNGTSIVSGSGAINLSGRNTTAKNVTSTSGDITISATRNVTLNQDAVTGGSAKVTVTADSDNDGNGNLSVSSNKKIQSGSGDIALKAGGSITMRETLSSGGNISAEAGNTVTVSGDVTTDGSGTVTLTADSDNNGSGSLTVTSGNKIETSSGGIDVKAAGNITLRDVTSDSGNVTANTRASVSVSGDITTGGAGSVTLNADTDMNNSGNVNMGTGKTITTDSGDVTLIGRDVSARKINSSGGQVKLEGSRNVSLRDDVTTGGSAKVIAAADSDGDGSGTLSMDSGKKITNGTGDIELNSAGSMTLRFVNSSGGNITAASNGSVTVVNEMKTNGSGNISITADKDGNGAGTFIQNGGSEVSTGGGNIDITGSDNMVVRTINAGAGDVTIKAQFGSRIHDDNNNTTRITANKVTLESGNRIGQSNGATQQIDLSANEVEATAANGSVFIANDKALKAGKVSAAGGSSDIFLTTTSGDLTVGDIQAADDVTLTSAGSVLGESGNLIQGDRVTVNTNADAGSESVSLRTAVNSWDVNASSGSAHLDQTAGNVSLTAQSTAVNVKTLTTNKGTIKIKDDTGSFSLEASSGNLDVTTDVDMKGGNTVLAAGGKFSQTAGKKLTSTAGDITVRTGMDLDLGVIESGGAVNIIAGAGASIFDANGDTLNITAVKDSRLEAGGVVGTFADAIDVMITGGALDVRADSAIGSFSGNLRGTVTPSNTLNVDGSTPGIVLFNDVVVYPLPEIPVPDVGLGPFEQLFTTDFISIEGKRRLRLDL